MRVPLEAEVHFGAADDGTHLSVVGYLCKEHRRAQHVPGEILSALGILGCDAHPVVRGEPTVAPAERPAAQVFGQPHCQSALALGRRGRYCPA